MQKLPGLYAKTVSIPSINDALRRRARTISTWIRSVASMESGVTAADSVQQRRAIVPDVLRLL